MSKDKLSVSVLIDSYNYGHYIEETIESVFSQTYPQEKIEIIVVDDGSSDDTSQRLEKYKDRIKFIEKENGGQASAFNTAFQHSIGDIVFLLDSDDIFYPDKIQEVCDTYEKHNCLCVFNLVELFGEHIDKQISSTTEYFLQFRDYLLLNSPKSDMNYWRPFVIRLMMYEEITCVRTSCFGRRAFDASHQWF